MFIYINLKKNLGAWDQCFILPCSETVLLVCGFNQIVGNSLELWSFELLVLASGLLPNPVVETSVLSIW